MYILCLAADYDGTLAQHGTVSAGTLSALRKLKAGGRRLVMVTGRELVALEHAFPELALFDRVVVENGAVVYDPASGRERVLAPMPPPHFVQRLIERRVEPISVGRAIVATWEPHQTAVLDCIRELGLELQVVFNKGAVMVLPTGVNKASGLKAALAELDISPRNVMGVGDAENDHAFLQMCGGSAAVANALPAVMAAVDVRLSGDHGAGVEELVARIEQEDVRLILASRQGLLLGFDRAGAAIHLPPARAVLIVGPSGCGKSRLAKLLTERMVEKELEFCAFDPEGDYHGLDDAVSLSDDWSSPDAEEALRLLRETDVNVVISTVTSSLSQRRQLLARLLPAIADLRRRTGRPHWLVVDEAHQLFPATEKLSIEAGNDLGAMILATINPAGLCAAVLRKVDILIAFDPDASIRLAEFAKAVDAPCPDSFPTLENGEILYWEPGTSLPPRALRIDAPRQCHRRHTGKYAVGDVGHWRSFYFRGPDKAYNLGAKNIFEFLEIADHVDDATWEHHLRAKDYSAWFRNVIGDEELANETAAVERNRHLASFQSRLIVRKAILRCYAAPGGDHASARVSR
ncbi:MAG: phosphoglycolate phosphatase [Bradyrhizobiaceae bacterium]|nr:MAG: phosphoglycolate phosphatase [Bradyrhizobiaceae bacterium]